jgi:hypothetical protein
MGTEETIQWKRMWKFPGYEVSSDGRVRSVTTGMFVQKRMDKFGREKKAKVLLPRGFNMVEVFVSELVYDYFPELRGEKKEAA